MDGIEPIRKDNGKVYCGSCRAQIVFYWARKPGFCAMCGKPIHWTPDPSVIRRLRSCVESAESTNDKLARVTTYDAREILDMLTFYMDIDGVNGADTAEAGKDGGDGGDG